jgi:hypothetical protein
MRAFLRWTSIALAAAAIGGAAAAHATTGTAPHRVPLADCPAGTNWNHVLLICQ